jgi:hypothetical protein
MDGATLTTSQLPAWIYFALVGLGSLCGIFFMFVLGLLAKRSEGNGRNDSGMGGRGSDCSHCENIKRVESAVNALNGRLDNLLLEFGKAGKG